MKVFNVLEEIKSYQKEIARLKEEYVMLQNSSDEVEEELQEKIKLLNEMNTKNYNNYCDAIKKINEVVEEITKDKMEQFDDYVIYLLEKYLGILGEGNEKD